MILTGPIGQPNLPACIVSGVESVSESGGSESMDSRMALLSIVIVILLGMQIFLRIDVEEGIRVAKAVDAEAGLIRGEEK